MAACCPCALEFPHRTPPETGLRPVHAAQKGVAVRTRAGAVLLGLAFPGGKPGWLSVEI